MSKYFIFLLIVAIVTSIATIFVFYTHTTTNNNPIKYDYYLEITQDSLYFMNKQGDTIHKEAYDDINPTPLQKSLDNDNL